MIVFICGLPRAGKTTFGRKLAKALGWSFLDSDAEIEKHIACPVSEYCQTFGEAFFRKAEALFLQTIDSRKKQIVALGGGTLTYLPSKKLVQEKGRVIFLSPPIEKIQANLKGKPLFFLKKKGLDLLVKERLSHYLDVADVIFFESSVRQGVDYCRGIL